jgi:hypothetical protein
VIAISINDAFVLKKKAPGIEKALYSENQFDLRQSPSLFRWIETHHNV